MRNDELSLLSRSLPADPFVPHPRLPVDDPHADWSRLLAAARRRLAELALPVPDPFDLRQFTAAAAERLGIRIRLVPVEMSSFDGGACHGMACLEGRTHYVFFVAGMSRVHSLHIAVHEVGHLLWRHRRVRGDGLAEAEADAMATVVLSRCESPRRKGGSPSHLRAAAERLARAWG